MAQLTTLCYLEKDGCYLMMHRTKKEHDINRDKWIGIGGKLEAGESPEECLLRECREETGLCLTGYALRGIVTFVTREGACEYMFLYTAHAWQGELAPECREGELAWVPQARIPTLPLWEGDHIFLHLLEQGAPFFSLKLVYAGERLEQACLNGAPYPLAKDQGHSPET